MRSECDTGKSTLIREAIKWMGVKRLVYIVSSKSLSNTQTTKLQEVGIDAVNYQYLGDFDELRDIDVVVTTIQSLYKLEDLEFDMCVLDELCSIARDAFCPTTNKLSLIHI